MFKGKSKINSHTSSKLHIDKNTKFRLAKDFSGATHFAKKHKDLKNEFCTITEEFLLQKEYSKAEDAISNLTKNEKYAPDIQVLALSGKIKYHQEKYSDGCKILSQISKEPKQEHIMDIVYQIEGLYVLGKCYGKLFQAGEAIRAFTTSYQLAISYSDNYTKEALQPAFSKNFFEKAALKIATWYDQTEQREEAIRWYRNAITVEMNLDKDQYFLGLSDSTFRTIKCLAKCLIECPVDQYPPFPHEEKNVSFLPKDAVEESLLCLLIYQEYQNKKGEEKKLKLDFTIYNDFAINLSSRENYSILADIFSSLVSTHLFNVSSYWYQFALSLHSSKRDRDCLIVIDQFLKRETKFPELYLIAAKICISSNNIELLDFKRGISYLERDFSEEFNVQKYHLMATAYAKIGANNFDSKEFKKSIEYLEQAYKLDKVDYLICYDLALQYAQKRDIPTSMKYIKEALLYNRSYPSSWALLSLLLTAQQEFQEALDMIINGINECSDNLVLLLIKAQLEEHLEKYQEGLGTYQHCFELWQHLESSKILDFEIDNPNSCSEASFIDDSSSRDNRSIFSQSLAVSSKNPLNQNTNRDPVFQGVKKSDLWLFFAGLFLKLKQFDDALNCIRESYPNPHFSAITYYQEGLVYEGKGEKEKALEFYEKVLSLNESHAEASLRSGILYLEQEKFLLAENSFTTACLNDPTNPECWLQLGKVFYNKQDFQKASDYFMTSVELLKTTPLIPFYKFLRLALE